MSLRLEMHAATHQGKVRSRNEDSMWMDAAAGIAVVADGMGGHPAGADASSLAVRAFADALTRDSGAGSAHGRGVAMAKGVEAAHDGIRAAVRETPDHEGMGTTLTAAGIDAAGELVLVHVGDSRAYLFRDGDLRPLTRDHTWVQEAVESGRLPSDAASDHPLAHVLTQAVGIDQPPLPDLERCTVRPGDLVLLCSDGLTGPVSDDRIRSILAEAAAEGCVSSGPDRLVEAALEGGGPDNVTVVLVRVVAGPLNGEGSPASPDDEALLTPDA